jgi:hypothetical protein
MGMHDALQILARISTQILGHISTQILAHISTQILALIPKQILAHIPTQILACILALAHQQSREKSGVGMGISALHWSGCS